MTSYTQTLEDILARLDSIEEAIGLRPPTVNSGFDGTCEGEDEIGQECLRPPIANLNGKQYCMRHIETGFLELRRLQEMVIDALAPMEAAMKAQGES